MAYFTEISVIQADTIIAKQDPLIIDYRDTLSYRNQHIEGSIQPHSALIDMLIKSNRFDHPLIVYSEKGNLSRDIASEFGRSGFKQCYSLKGGYAAWKERTSLYSVVPYSIYTNEWLVETGFEEQSLNIADENKYTALMHSCREGLTRIAAELISASANIEQRDSDGNTALWAACFGGNIETVELIIKNKANINNQNDEGCTALIYASFSGKTNIVKLLLQHDSNINIKNHDGYTALDVATNPDIVDILKHENAGSIEAVI
ncbi:ankyrin repeat domain-containing protein [Teredinibacter haidensis]|uniref:ankyrin repeat domain-containing protein n=1 Tax=Teredinibacter haidensis TaxID=2731755 RepID=UPI000948C19A|nr:ankyrin repeat domain-containing protein [Teredinibacter haidensis]